MRPAWCAVVVVCADLLSGPLAAAGEKPADAALLEFLGSVDSNMPGWHKYLEEADAGRSAPGGSAVPVKSSAPADRPPPPDAPPKAPQP
jgi:hypothetical protein